MDDTAPHVDISTRPFLGDLLAATAPPAHRPPAGPGRIRENSHLLAAVTGTPAPPAQAQACPVPSPAPPADSQPLRTRERQHSPLIRVDGYLDVDWNVVADLTRQIGVPDRASRTRDQFDVAAAPAGPETDVERDTWGEIDRIITRHTTRIVQDRGADYDWGAITRAHYQQAVFDQAHRYGRLQQYLREPDVEDISVVGSDNVVVTRTDGRRERRPAIAGSDTELERMIADIAGYRGRSFAHPSGNIDLDIGGARLSATGVGITSVTNLTVRKHNLVDVTLADLVANGTITAEIAAFLTAVSRANLCVMIAGYPASGKTTMLRAMSNTIDPSEKIVTIETERELYLGKLPDRHWQVQDLQYVPAQYAGEDSTAGFSLAQCLKISLRSSAERILFAEIRAEEAPIAMQAMQAGKGSMSTIHARSADDAIHRLADVLMATYGLSDDTVPLRQIVRSVDVMLYIDRIDNGDGTRRRVVSQVSEVTTTTEGEAMAADVWRYNFKTGLYDRREKLSVGLADRLRRVGYDIDEGQS